MVVGIVDLDLLLNRSTYQLNIDVMQISAYYKRLGYSVKISRSMKPEDLGWYSLIYVIYNGEQEIFIDNLAKDNRVVLIGKYFYREHSALPQEIIDIYPDKTIYENLLQSDLLSKTRRNSLLIALHKADFLRIHENSNQKFLTDNSEQILIYDLDINISDYELLERLGRQFTLYYPIKVKSLKEGLKWLEIKAFARKTVNHMFLAENFPESDLMNYLQLPTSHRKMFLISFGDCSKENYLNNFKLFVKFVQKAKTLSPTPQITINPINDPDFNFLFNLTKRWYNGKKDNLNISLFKYGFSQPQHFKLMVKIQAKDPELAQLLKSTLYTRYQNEQARNNYRRLD